MTTSKREEYSKGLKELREIEEGNRSEWFRLTGANPKLKIDLSGLRIKHEVPRFNRPGSIPRWMEEEVNRKLPHIFNDLEILRKNHDIPKKWKQALFEILMKPDRDPALYNFYTGFPEIDARSGAIENWQEVRFDNPHVQRFLDIFRAQIRRKQRLSPELMKTNLKVKDWRPLREAWKRSGGTIKDFAMRMTVNPSTGLPYAAEYVRKKFRELDDGR